MKPILNFKKPIFNSLFKKYNYEEFIVDFLFVFVERDGFWTE